MARLPPHLPIGLVLASAALVHADPAAIPPAGEPGSLDALAAADKACAVWSDGCVVCRRRAAAAFACSTPGIACQPSSFACRDPGRTPRSGAAH